MLVNTNIKSNPEGFNPNVDNTIHIAKPSSGQKTLYMILLFFSWIPLIIPGIIWWVIRIKKANAWIKQQMEINAAASSIDVNLTKRAETLIKLLDQTKGYLKHERETLIQITKERSGNSSSNPNDIKEFDQKITDIAKNINIQIESYPNLKGSSVIGELMSASQYVETEISSSRRLYNQLAQRFNADIFAFPNICIAEKNNLNTFPLFSASESQKKDVDMSSLSSF